MRPPADPVPSTRPPPLGATVPRARAPRTAVARDAAATPSGRRVEARVYDAILRALLGGSLRPGTPLRERQVAQTFQATRGAVRKVLARLGAEGKLELRPHRGAFVPQPTEDTVRQAYGMRRVLECGLVALLAEGGVSARALTGLDALVTAERRAQRTGRRDDAVRLAGDVHRALAAAFANPELESTLAALIGRTQIYVALFESAQDAACACDEHAAIVRAVRRRDAAAAVRAMDTHLDRVQQRVVARMPRHDAPDVAAILRASIGPAPGPPARPRRS